jgi:hypothetical protein
MSFSEDIKRFEVNTKGKIDLTARKVALELFRKVVMATPVGNPTLWKSAPPPGYVGGRARGNWQANIGPQSTAVATDTKDKDGNSTMNGILGSMASWKPSDINAGTIWIGNALPYIIRLEYDSWSTQAPSGMVRVALSEIKVGGVAPSSTASPGGVLS